jgi:hypothetical protein
MSTTDEVHAINDVVIKDVVNPIIFREYIGVKDYPDNFTFPTQIINDKIPNFHFILGIATEDYDLKGKGTGNFQRTWDDEHFGAKQVKSLKDAHSKVKVVISIGGRGPKLPFNPAANEIWIENATTTIKKIITDYKHQDFNDGCGCNVIIDGIDINYEVVESNDGDFAHCIGKLITNVKDDFPRDRFVSIAPSDVSSKHYKRLYQEYPDEIDFVDYQFYNQKVSSKDDFVKLFRALAANDYDINKLLAGYSTDFRDPHGEFKQEDFIEGCKSLVRKKLLKGVFLWNANDSKVPISNEPPFFLEGLMQKILTHSD